MVKRSQQHPPAIILGSGVTALGALRSLARLGIPCLSNADPDDLTADSRWYRAAVADNRQPLARQLAQVDAERAVLIPCSDAMATAVATLPPELRARFVASAPAADVLEQLVDKARFHRLLDAADVAHPRTYVLDDPAELAAIPHDVWASAFLKPRESQAFFAAHGVKAFAVRSPAEARERLGPLTEAGLQMLVQEYIPGPASEHYFIDGFVDRRHRIQATFARRRLRMYPPDFGNSSMTISVARDDARDAIAAVETLFAHLPYRGAFSAEFKRDPRDGVFKILEVNARAWWYVEFAARCGVNVPLMMYDDALERPITPVQSYEIGRALVYPYYDYFACRELVRRGELSLAEWTRSWATSWRPVAAIDDPRPGLRRAGQWLGRQVRRVLRQRAPAPATPTSAARR